MTGYKSKRAAALDEEGMYLVHQTAPVKFKCTVVDDQHPNGVPLEQWGDPPQRPWVGLTDEEVKAHWLILRGCLRRS